MSEYTYYIADARTGVILGDLPFADVTMEWALSAAGVFSGTLAITDPDVIERGALHLIAPGKNVILVDLDGSLIWGGIMWTRQYDSDQAIVTVTAADFWSYFSRRIVSDNITETSIPLMSLVDAIITPNSLVENPPANLTLAYTTEPGAPADATLAYTYSARDEKFVSELIEGLAETLPGFDFRQDIKWTVPGMTYAATITFGRPRLGQPLSTSTARFDLPGNITAYTEQVDGTRLSARTVVVGTSDGEIAPSAVFEDMSMCAVYPCYEGTEQIDESNTDILELRGEYLANLRLFSKTTYGVTVRSDATPVVGSYKIGDDCLLAITDALHPAPSADKDGILTSLRIGHMEHSVPDQTVVITPWDGSNG